MLAKQEGNTLLIREDCVYCWVVEETPELGPRQAQVMGVDVGQVS